MKKMPRVYVRKTNRGAPRDILERAAAQVHQGNSLRNAAHNFDIDRTTLARFIKATTENENAETGYRNCRTKNMIFTAQMEQDLAEHIKRMADMFHGLSKSKCRELAYEFANANRCNIPDSWKKNKKVGESFWLNFKDRQNLLIRTPEATSLARATAFNKHTAGLFFKNLAQVLERHSFTPNDIYNLDETGCTTVQDPGNVVCRGRKKGTTLILTDTPIRNAIEEKTRLKEAKKTRQKAPKKQLFQKGKGSKAKKIPQKKDMSSSSESETDMEMELDDNTDFSEEDEITEGDFVIVKIAGKQVSHNYISRVDEIDGDDVEGIFLRKVPGKKSSDPCFVLDPNDEASYPVSDIVKKLPAPTHAGSTSRCTNQFRFPISLEKWDLR